MLYELLIEVSQASDVGRVLGALVLLKPLWKLKPKWPHYSGVRLAYGTDVTRPSSENYASLGQPRLGGEEEPLLPTPRVEKTGQSAGSAIHFMAD